MSNAKKKFDPPAEEELLMEFEEDEEEEVEEAPPEDLELFDSGEKTRQIPNANATRTGIAISSRLGRKKNADDTLAALQEAASTPTQTVDESGDFVGVKALIENKGDKYPQLYGNYYVLDHLIDGGMAKICRARFLGEEAEKIVAIKMVQEKFSKDKEFKAMFVDELKVSFGLQHPNIAATFDYGEIREQLFVSMEYIHGKNLDQVLRKMQETQRVYPVDVAVFIISKVCEGLGYAHKFTNNLTGETLNIVHRDISPHNIMLTFEGYVKVIDFGIAKASSNQEKTQDGAIKGKVSYIAPEYLDGKEIDGRYDEFAVGLTIWEMLVGKRVFKAETDILTLRQILECNVPAPSLYNKEIPPELDKIILKALSKDPNDRYPDMEALGRDLVKFLYTAYPDFYEAQLGPFLQELYQDEYDRDCETFRSWGEIDLQTINDQVKQLRDMRREEAQQRGVPMLEFDLDEGTSLVGSDGEEEEMTLTLDKEGVGGGYRARARQRQSGHQEKLMQKMKALAAGGDPGDGSENKTGSRKVAATGSRKIRKRVRPSHELEEEQESAAPKKKKKKVSKKTGKKISKKKKTKKKKRQPFVDKAFIIGGLLIAAWHFGLSKKVLDLIFPTDDLIVPKTKIEASAGGAPENHEYEKLSEEEFFEKVDQESN